MFKKIFTWFILLIVALGLRAQDFYISFRPQASETSIDSIHVTSLRTNQQVRLAAGDSLQLTKNVIPSSMLLSSVELGTLYPNPSTGEAALFFSTRKQEQVEVCIFNASGQLLISEKKLLMPGVHSFRVKYPTAGIYSISVLKGGGLSGYKAICTGDVLQECRLYYKGTEEIHYSSVTNPLKEMSTSRKMYFLTGDILYCSVFSGRNNTIITDSPIRTKVYEVEFHECIDPDNSSYPVVKIGDQWWMAGNLTWLPAVSPSFEGSETSPRYYVYGHESTNIPAAKAIPGYIKYGVLYNWTGGMGGAASSSANPSGVRGVCPAGWHLPGDAEWDLLSTALGGENTAGGAMKTTGTSGWESPNTGATNQSGFTGLPGGFRSNNASFDGEGLYGYFWSSTGATASDAWYRGLSNRNAYLGRNSGNKQNGFSIRCVWDVPITATVLTTAISGITQVSSTGGGVVTTDGNAAVTARGVCWSTTSTPTTSDSKTSNGSGTGSYTSNLTGLTAGTTYYVRAYATNSQGTAYGNQVAFTTKPPDTQPTVTTTAISGITQITATGGGNVISDGNVPVTARGVCWSSTGTPTISDSKTTDGSGTGSFISKISGLTPGTTYYVRAWATNSLGTAYGSQVSFTTDPVITLPAVATATADSIRAWSAVLGGNVTSDGNAPVTTKGVCWNTTGTPTITDSRTYDGTGTGSFRNKVTGLSPKTHYFVRAYATNSAGTAYGNQVTFTTQYPAVDADGNNYNSVVIGNQEWMAENLKTTRYDDGTPVAPVTDNSGWENLTYGAYCWYDNEINNKNTWGALYNWYAVTDTHKLCPTGWHVPDDTEWMQLIDFLGGELVAGGKMKETGTSHWANPNTGATNTSGFTGLPGGIRGGFGGFYNVDNLGYFWSSTSFSTGNAWCKALYYNAEDIGNAPFPKSFGFSIRCIRDK
jgi:uncharacterized protein (TIGR02145 family)